MASGLDISKHSRLGIILAFATIYLVWGSTYLAIRISVETIPPFMMASVRFFLSCALFFLIAHKSKGFGASRTQWINSGIIGVFLVVGGNGLVTIAEETVPSGLAALLIATVPLWIVLVDWMRRGGTRPSVLVMFGMAIGFAGVGLLINPTGIGSASEIDPLGALFLVMAPIFWSLGSIYSRHADQPESKLYGVAIQMLVGAIVLAFLSLGRGELSGFQIDSVSSQSLIGLIYLVIPGSLGYYAYIWLLRRTTPAKVATYAYVNPVIALFLGNWIASEPISVWTIGCSVIILTAVIIIVASKGRTEKTGIKQENRPDGKPMPVCTD